MKTPIKLKKRAKIKRPSKSPFLLLNNLLSIELSSSKSRIKLSFFESFYRELFALTTAGLSIIAALEVLAENVKKKEERQLLSHLMNSLLNGLELSTSLQNSKAFKPYDITSIKIGEETGSLTEVLQDLSNYYTSRIKLNKEVLSALSYPALVLVVALGVILFMLNFLIPMFEDIFKRMGGELPAITQTLIGVSEFLRENTGALVLGTCLLILGGMYLKRYYKVRRMLSQTLLKTPIVGPLIRLVYLGRFARAMYLLLKAKVPILQALDLVNQMILFIPLNEALSKAKNEIEKGGNLSQGLQKEALFDLRFRALLKVAEQSNSLALVFNRIALQYAQELTYRSKLMRELLEPLVIIGLGLIVALILVAMYLPIFNMNSGL